MNKKKLSVVMAGAMLASSVAPVLAAETTEKDYTVNNSNKGLLIKELRKLILEGGTFENVTANGDLAGHSIHYVTVDGITETYNKKTVAVVESEYKAFLEALNKDLKALGENTEVKLADLRGLNNGQEHTIKVGDATVTFKITNQATDSGEYTINYLKKFDNTNIDTLEYYIQNIEDGKVRVWDYGHIEKDGKLYAKTLEETKVPVKFTTTTLEKAYNDFVAAKRADNDGYPESYPAVYDMEYKDGTLTVYTRHLDTDNADTRQKFTYTTENDSVDFTKAVNEQGKEYVKDFTDSTGSWITAKIYEFKKITNTVQADKDIDNKHLYTVTITDVDAEHKVVLSDLYNGLFLTEKGEELLNTLREYDAEKYTVRENTIETEKNGLYSFTIELEKTVNKETIKNTVIITANNKDRLDFFRDGISAKYTLVHNKAYRKFPVQKLVGANRHETAVKVARENADIRTVAENGNIVLVNSDSLVDGLAAAPLAASVVNKFGNSTYLNGFVAPILLTNKDGLDKVTKDYIKEVVAHQRVGALDKVTVYLVGGEAVISKAVENDLEEAGLRVVRAGGKDREATSLEVAKLIEKDTKAEFNNAFVVGANGEADAMSVAAVAADNTLDSTDNKVTPIIVESVHGISDETIDYLKGYKVAKGKDVTIVGGEKVVSKATEETLKEELKGKKVERIAGANRQATNAKVIKTFYDAGSLDHVLVSKDGIARKGELIDALTATSIAAKYHTPIVLGTNDLSKEQIEAIEVKANRRADKYVYQIGGNVAESVVRTIAERLNLAK